MRKWFLFSLAGISALMFGCESDPVMDKQTFLPAPEDDTAVKEVAPMPPAPAVKPVATVKYEPMTGAVSTGGVDRVPAGQKGGAVGKNVSGSGFYVVQPGDFPAKIAKKLHVNVNALMAANNLDAVSARKLQVGQKLRIPSGKAAAYTVKTKKSGSKTVKNTVSAPAPALKDGKYTVVAGDNPAKIAKRFHVKVSALLAANNLDASSAKGLQIGQKLIIPGASAETAPTPTVVPSTEAAPATATGDTQVAPVAEQTVAPAGDSAPATDTPSVPPAADAAAVSEPVSQDSGSVNLEADTTWEELAKKYGCTVEELKRLNPEEASSEKVGAGAFIILPPKNK